MDVSWIALVLLAAEPGANPREADELFKKGREFVKSGRASEACPLFDRSQALDPALGTLLNLADCDERTGQWARAYRHFEEVLDWAERKGDDVRAKLAAEHLATLKDKVSWVSVASASPTEGLEAAVQGFSIHLTATPVQVAVDVGDVLVVATAPGRQPWTTHVKVNFPRETRDISVPQLWTAPPPPVAHANPVPPSAPPPPVAVVAAPVKEEPSAKPPPLAAPTAATRTVVQATPSGGRPTGGIVLMSVGAAALIGGGVGLGWSYSTYNAFQAQQIGGYQYGNPTVTRAQFDSLHTTFPVSWAAGGVGVAAIASGAFWYFGSGSARVALVPERGGGSLALSGQF